MLYSTPPRNNSPCPTADRASAITNVYQCEMESVVRRFSIPGSYRFATTWRGRTRAFIVPRESDAIPLICAHVASGTVSMPASRTPGKGCIRPMRFTETITVMSTRPKRCQRQSAGVVSLAAPARGDRPASLDQWSPAPSVPQRSGLARGQPLREQVGSVIKRLQGEGAIETVGIGRANKWRLKSLD